MNVSVTLFGAVLLPGALFVFLFRRVWLIYLLFLAAVLQGPAFASATFNGQTYGLTPFMLLGILIGFDLVLRLRAGAAEAAQRELDGVLNLWLLSAAVSVFSAIALPVIFSGIGVYAPLDKQGVHGAITSLSWSANHLAQVVNVTLLAGIFFWIWLQRNDPGLPRRILVAAVVATGIAVLIGLQQRLAWNGLVPMWNEFWASNPTYAQNYRSMAGEIPRVSWPFVEASYASVWFAASFGGFLTLFLLDIQRHRALFGVMVSLFALGNTLGATGFLAAVAGLAIAFAGSLVMAVRRPELAGGLAYRLTLASLAASCVLLGVFLMLRNYGLLDVSAGALQNVLSGRSQTLLGDLRPHADRHSMALTVQSWGLGVGMGSHRGSSYLLTLAANTGILGLALFLVAVGRQFRMLGERVITAADAPTAFFFGSGVVMLIAVTIAIPDQNWPALWMFLASGFACVIAKGEIRHPASQST